MGWCQCRELIAFQAELIHVEAADVGHGEVQAGKMRAFPTVGTEALVLDVLGDVLVVDGFRVVHDIVGADGLQVGGVDAGRHVFTLGVEVALALQGFKRGVHRRMAIVEHNGVAAPLTSVLRAGVVVVPQIHRMELLLIVGGHDLNEFGILLRVGVNHVTAKCFVVGRRTRTDGIGQILIHAGKVQRGIVDGLSLTVDDGNQGGASHHVIPVDFQRNKLYELLDGVVPLEFFLVGIFRILEGILVAVRGAYYLQFRLDVVAQWLELVKGEGDAHAGLSVVGKEFHRIVGIQ